MKKDADREAKRLLARPPQVVNTIILGPVVASQILTAGGSIVINGTPVRPDVLGTSNHVLFSSVDWELLDISGFSADRIAISKLQQSAHRELRLLLLAIPPEGAVVLPPTYYCESPICREVLFSHVEAIEQRYIRLVTEYVDLAEYFEQKQQRYEKASHFAHYDDAYFHPTYPPISILPFQKTPKQSSVGRRALDLWDTSLNDPEVAIHAPRVLLDELCKRVLDTERPAFLWENVAEHLESLGVGPAAVSAQQIRALKNRAYLTAYTLNGISVPHGSSIVTDLVVPSIASSAYHLLAWQRILEAVDMLNQVCGMDVQQFLQAKARPEVARVVARIRTYLSRGKPTDWILSILDRGDLLKGFVNGLRST
jgi:hypothetical protein